MSNPHPAVRRDLVVSRQETGAGTRYVVKDPQSRRFFNVGEPEYFIIQQLDGTTGLDVVQKRAEERFHAALEPNALEQFVGHLSHLQLLEPESGDKGLQPPRRGRVRGSLFYLRLRAFDPDAVLTRLIGGVGFFFTPFFVGLSGLTILAALGVMVANWGAIGSHLGGLNVAHALLWAWPTIIIVAIAHELAHALTCKRFGGEVREMGFLLIYFHPALYTNVSDAWLFPRKSQRLWVSFAGAYFELFLWALATLIWWLTPKETMLSSLALMIMITSGLKSLFNLNPLIKLDGYYLLSDLLEVPNLRGRAFRYLAEGIKGRLGMARQQGAKVPKRERRVYLLYGLLAIPYTIYMLGFIVWTFGGFIAGGYLGVGIALLAVLAFGVLRNPIVRVLRLRSFRLRLGSQHGMTPSR